MNYYAQGWTPHWMGQEHKVSLPGLRYLEEHLTEYEEFVRMQAEEEGKKREGDRGRKGERVAEKEKEEFRECEHCHTVVSRTQLAEHRQKCQLQNSFLDDSMLSEEEACCYLCD
jgi:hypothetical protein